jgi:hypothetical protein
VPRIVPYQDVESGIFDLVGGLSGGFLQGTTQQLLTQQERDRQQREAAMGNPYQRVARLATWQSLPEEVRSGRNAPLYQNLVAGGADPMQVIGAHRELETDPVYGDQKTQAARKKALEVAMRAGHVQEGDEATREAVMRGEMTLGKLIGRKDAQTEKQADRQYEEGQKKADRETKNAEEAQRAAGLQQALGVGLPKPRQGVVVPTGGASFTQVPLPDQPGQTFTNPEDVKTVAAHERQQQSLAIQRQRAEQAKASLQRAQGREDLTPEARQKVEAALEVMNDPNATEAEYAQAFVVAREFGFAPQAAALQRESPGKQVMREQIEAQLTQLRNLANNMLGPNKDEWVANYAERHGIPKVQVQGIAGPDMRADPEAVRQHLEAQTQALNEQLNALYAEPGAAPAGQAPADSPDPEAAAAVDAMVQILKSTPRK